MILKFEGNSIAISPNTTSPLPVARWELRRPMFVIVSEKELFRDFEDEKNVLGSRPFLPCDSDYWHFRKKNLDLIGVSLAVPEKRIQDLPFVFPQESEMSSLKLEKATNFNIGMMTHRWFDRSTNHLVCINKTSFSSPVSRFKITRNLDILVEKDLLVGWVLSSAFESIIVPGKSHKKVVELKARKKIAIFMDFINDEITECEDNERDRRLDRFEKMLRDLGISTSPAEEYVDSLIQEVILNLRY